MGILQDLTKGAGEVDKFVETSEERQKTLTERQKIDMESDNWLSKSIRPITVLVLLFLEILIVILSAFGHKIPDEILIQHGTLLASSIGFYFYSKKSERVATRNADANAKIVKMQLEHDFKKEKIRLRKNG